MKIDAEVLIGAQRNHVIVPIDPDYVDADKDDIYQAVAVSDEMFKAFGYEPSPDEFEILNIDDIIEDIMALPLPVGDASEDCDYNYLKKQIVGVLRRYFDYNDNGDPNPEFDDTYTAQEAIDDIHEIIGNI